MCFDKGPERSLKILRKEIVITEGDTYGRQRKIVLEIFSI